MGRLLRAAALACALVLCLTGCGGSANKGSPAPGGSSQSSEPGKTGEVSEITDLEAAPQVNLYGRNYYNSGQHAEAFVNSASGFEVKIRGTSLTVSARSVPQNRFVGRFSVFVDGEKDSNAKVVQMPSNVFGFSTITLVDGLPEGEHVIKVLKRTASNEDTTYIENISTDGVFLEAPPRPEISIEVFGDSITVGEGVLREVSYDETTGVWNDSNAYNNETQNVFQSYAGYAASMLDADFRVFGREGIAMKYSTQAFTALSNYNSVSIDIDANERPYDWSGYTPDAVVIYLGTNDYSQGLSHPELGFSYAGLEEAFRQFIWDAVGAHYGKEIPIVLCSGQMARGSDLDASMDRVVASLKGEFPNIARVTFAPCAVGHPVASEGEAAGRILADKLRELLGK